MDSTLINTKSGGIFARNSSDWVWWDPSVPKKLKEIHEDGYKIVIFSNQAGIEGGQVKPNVLKGKFIQLFKSLKIPFQALCACLLYTSPSPRDLSTSRMPSSA